MDCEKFDRVVLDLLYDELDELTAAAARRHMDHCARCGPIGNGLRATREVGVLPVVAPPTGLRDRILAAEREARAGLALEQRMGRTISMLAGYAMRPQLAMAAVLILMVGMSLMLLQPQPGSRDSVRVTERGVPETELEALAESTPAERGPAVAGARGPDPSAPSDRRRDPDGEEAPRANEAPGGGADDEAAYDAAMDAFRSGKYADARTGFDTLARAGGPRSADAELMAARAARYTNGCVMAAPLLENVAAKHGGTGVGNEATWLAADCYNSLGRTAQARDKYTALLKTAGYAERARVALDALSAEGGSALVASRAAPAELASPPKAALKPGAAPAAAPPKAAATTTAPRASTDVGF